MKKIVGNDISYCYRKDVYALKNIKLKINEGDFCSVLGPNGSGKTTLLKVLSGVLKPNRGEVSFDGGNLYEMNKRDISKKIGYVPQNIRVDFPFTCQEIVLMGRYPYMFPLGIESKNDYDIVKEIMINTDIMRLADRKINEISGGERQRVFIAQAMAMEPEVIMLDEPVSALDIKYTNQIMNLLKNLNKNKKVTIIMIIHDINLSLFYSNRVLVLKDGILYKNGDPKDIIDPEFIKEVFDIEIKVIQGKENREIVIIPKRI